MVGKTGGGGEIARVWEGYHFPCLLYHSYYDTISTMQCLLDCKFGDIKFGVRKDRKIMGGATTVEMGEGKRSADRGLILTKIYYNRIGESELVSMQSEWKWSGPPGT